MARQPKKAKVEFNPQIHGEQLERLVKEASDLKIEVQSANAAVSDLRKQAIDELGIKGKMFNTLVRLKNKGTVEEFETENEEVVELYNEIFK